jgi:hypothetical protein
MPAATLSAFRLRNISVVVLIAAPVVHAEAASAAPNNTGRLGEGTVAEYTVERTRRTLLLFQLTASIPIFAALCRLRHEVRALTAIVFRSRFGDVRRQAVVLIFAATVKAAVLLVLSLR